MNDLISVIIPVFNTEKSIERCFSSIKKPRISKFGNHCY